MDVDVFPERMMAEPEDARGLIFSERVLLALVQSGMARNEGYLIVQEAAKRVWAGESDLRTVLASDPRVTNRLTDAQLDDCFKMEHHMQGIDVPFERLGLLAADVPAAIG
jgi:adenylosuccinate lyase